MEDIAALLQNEDAIEVLAQALYERFYRGPIPWSGLEREAWIHWRGQAVGLIVRLDELADELVEERMGQ